MRVADKGKSSRHGQKTNSLVTKLIAGNAQNTTLIPWHQIRLPRIFYPKILLQLAARIQTTPSSSWISCILKENICTTRDGIDFITN